MKRYGMFLHLLLTGLVGLVFAIVGESLYHLLTNVIWKPIGVGLYFALFAAVILGMSFLMAKLRGDYNIWQNREGTTVFSTNYKRAAIAIAVVFMLSGLCEFLYDTDFNKPLRKKSITSYVFLIDDSGSMGGDRGSDPEMKRVDAISEIMEKESKKTEFAIYRFNDQVERVRDMAPYKKGETYNFSPEGTTDIVGALRRVVDDIVSGELEVGKNPRILLLSDGYADSDIGLDEVLDDCNANGIIVSTIGYGVSNPMLKEISEKTGGSYSEVLLEQISNLGDAMKNAISSNYSRNLLSDRYVKSLDILYMILRVVFLVLIGVVISWIKQKCYCGAIDHTFEDVVFFVSISFCTFAAILVELLFKLVPPLPFLIFTDIAPRFIRILFCVLFAITPGYFWKDESGKPARK